MKTKQKWTPEPWTLSRKIASYNTTGEEAEKLKSAKLPTSFKALSIGTSCGQIAIIPLDESSKENGERIIACVNACAGIEDPADLRDVYNLSKAIADDPGNRKLYLPLRAAIAKSEGRS